MPTGCLPGPGASPVRHPRTAPAAALPGAVLAFGAWQWHTSPHALLPSAAAPGPHEDDDDGNQSRPRAANNCRARHTGGEGACR